MYNAHCIFSFTTALRSGFTFKGSESITLGGGEEIWLFINKILVIEIIADRQSNTTSCQKLDLSVAATAGKTV